MAQAERPTFTVYNGNSHRGSASGSPAEKDADASTAETTESGNDDSINVVVR